MPETQTSVIVNVAFLLAAAAFLLRDILHLRLVALVANLGLIYGAAQRPAWVGAPHLYWYFAFLAINTVQSAILLYDFEQIAFSPQVVTLAIQILALRLTLLFQELHLLLLDPTQFGEGIYANSVEAHSRRR